MEWEELDNLDDIDDVIEGLVDLEEDVTNLIPKRYLRDIDNPLEFYSEDEFRMRFRFSKDNVVNILHPLVEDLLKKPDQRGLPLPSIQKLMLALRFYATGNIQQVSGDLHGVSQATAGGIVHTISGLLAERTKDFVKLPATEADCRKAMRWFYEIRGFPGVVACVDGTHIPIKNPGGVRPEIYRNRHGWFSLNVQVSAGANMEIVDVSCRRGGSFHDATIFEASGLRRDFEEKRMHQGLLLGDNGYPCLPYLFTPLGNPQSMAETRYNRAHISTRNVVERTLGVWKRRFRCLTKTLETSLNHSLSIILATTVLYNISRRSNDELPEDRVSLGSARVSSKCCSYWPP
uniref:DDE Tnp4 domain-containing protein n=1 Tax=Timema monikensis TaxID=170555 RepID=A0A7R9ELW1_9NEOP|nr:unnamed protein product [Timema monikensis]